MPKLKLDYQTAIPIETVGAQMAPIFVINTETMMLQGQFFERQIRLDTNEERVVVEKPISFEIILTEEAVQQMMAAVLPLAMAQGVLRPATPGIVADPVPEPPPPATEPPIVTITPALATVAPEQVVHLDVSVQNATDPTVEVTAPDGGSIAGTYDFTAPTTPGEYRVEAKLVSDPTRMAVAIITVQTA